MTTVASGVAEFFDTLSIVLPCYNEAMSIGPVVKQACASAAAIAREFEVVVVDDGSVDGTAARVTELGFENVIVVRHPRNQGYGAALRTGFRTARHGWVFYTDGDGQFDLTQLEPFVRQAREGTVLAGYRSPRADASLLRSINGRGWTTLTNATLGLGMRDVNCAFKLFPRSLLDQVPMASRGAVIDAEILWAARRMGLPIVQLPVKHSPRRHGQATGARPSVVLRALWELALLRMRAA
jgi:glycosyltransferase involved in cell wall biosynthesis